jgi:hypothetical protein
MAHCIQDMHDRQIPLDTHKNRLRAQYGRMTTALFFPREMLFPIALRKQHILPQEKSCLFAVNAPYP